MAKEVEYKYICNYIPDDMKPYKTKLSQGYVHIDKSKQVRVRLNWSFRRAWMCIKFMEDAFREEFEVEMDFDEGYKLFALCKYRLDKNRYSKRMGNHTLDIDEYPDGTLIIEVEFFEHPLRLDFDEILTKYPFIGENVDGQWKYNNYNFAGFPESEYK